MWTQRSVSGLCQAQKGSYTERVETRWAEGGRSVGLLGGGFVLSCLCVLKMLFQYLRVNCEPTIKEHPLLPTLKCFR